MIPREHPHQPIRGKITPAPSRSPIIPSAHIPSSPLSNPHQDYSHTSCSCSHCLLITDHPQPSSPVISPVIPRDTDLDTRILNTGTFNAAMNVLTRA
ncbi:hypothetical protein L211DRAFT_844232, partial [Terfezia boudieri ATCC MYA-4762]